MSAMLLGRRRYVSTAEFARLTGEKPDTIRKRCLRGTITCKRKGSRWRVWVGEARAREG